MEQNLRFDSSWNKIAISISGGADSALLSYLICRNITDQELHFINHIRCWKTKPWQKDDADRVLDWFRQKFPQISQQVHRNFIPPEMEWADKGPTMTDEYGKKVSGDNIEIRAFSEYICYTNNIDAYYNAVTKNPSETSFSGMPTRDLEKTSKNTHLEYMTHLGKEVIHPFRFIEKNQIIKEYKKQGILDLLELTRSCEGVFSNITYENYDSSLPVPVCGECFWCKEREWAIDNS
jgi:7-cyano-7-deazaguanine synthase in queuosine biosynthesis